jgi:uncharacterized protein (TIGR00730 family)
MDNPLQHVVNRTICVFCGSSMGHAEAYGEAARELGESLAREGYGLVCGGGGAGLLGTVARAAHLSGGPVTAVIPDFLHRRVPALSDVTRTIITGSMHERKATMFDLSSAFISLPGGIGTLEETVEMLTWAQLKLHSKPIVLLNLKEYWTPFIRQLEQAIEAGFAERNMMAPLHVVDSVSGAIALLRELPLN